MIWPEVGIYVGPGTSHSWTWFADVFERSGICGVSFFDESEVAAGALKNINVFFISGGDTFAIADGLGRQGAEQLEAFITKGGVYIGSCAGAYLPLKSSLSPLNLFNFVAARITNLTKDLPVPKKMAEKFCTEYGCQYVYHPVREEVRVKIVDRFSCRGQEITVPLYGGPALTGSDDIEVLALYTGFTDKTEFLVDEKIAEQTLIGNVAAARKQFGKGVLYLFGPHFEHPGYPEANRILIEAMLDGFSEGNTKKDINRAAFDSGNRASKKLVRALRSEISNSRIVALALERMRYQWRIGRKIYDPEKISVFLESIWSRIEAFEHTEAVDYIREEEIEHLWEIAKRATGMLREIKKDSDKGEETTGEAEQLFADLRKLSAKFLSIYFRLKRIELKS